MRRGWARVGWAGVLMVCGMGSMPVRAGQMGNAPVGGQSAPAAEDRQDPAIKRMEEQVAKGRNDERQKRLVADTAKLYELAGQLKDEVAKTDKNTLSVDVVKKAEEIEKLAKNVKDKMRG